MGRAERRRAERRNRIEDRKNKVLLTREDINKMKEDITYEAAGYHAEALMTCFALSLKRLYGFGPKRIGNVLEYIDGLMSGLLDDSASIEQYKKELENETGVIVKCKD